MGAIYNPAKLGTGRAVIKIRLTDRQVEEMAHRLDITAETDDLDDWGWLDGRTLCILNNATAINNAIMSRYSDIRTCLDIARDNVHHDPSPEARGFLASMQSLVRKVENAVTEQAGHNSRGNGEL